MKRQPIETTRTLQYGLRLADHFHLCPRCERRVDCDGPPCVRCPCPDPPATDAGPLFGEKESA